MPSNPTDPAALEPADGEKLIIETPELTSIEFPLAGIGSRFLAILIDSLIQTGIVIVMVLLFAGLSFGLGVNGSPQSSTAAIWVTAILIFGFFLLIYGYFILFEAIWNGQTPGKRLTHLRVIKDTGQPINAIDAVGRNLLRIIDQLPVGYGVGLLCAWISPQSKRLGDYVAGTVVVHEKSVEPVPSHWTEPQQAAGAHQYSSSRLTPEEFTLVETFLSRRQSLEPGVRYDMATGIVRRIESKLVLPPDRPSAEKLLEEIARERRSNAGYR
jgi:uncharacterized RDD family membrane protein YckC